MLAMTRMPRLSPSVSGTTSKPGPSSRSVRRRPPSAVSSKRISTRPLLAVGEGVLDGVGDRLGDDHRQGGGVRRRDRQARRRHPHRHLRPAGGDQDVARQGLERLLEAGVAERGVVQPAMDGGDDGQARHRVIQHADGILGRLDPARLQRQQARDQLDAVGDAMLQFAEHQLLGGPQRLHLRALPFKPRHRLGQPVHQRIWLPATSTKKVSATASRGQSKLQASGGCRKNTPAAASEARRHRGRRHPAADEGCQQDRQEEGDEGQARHRFREDGSGRGRRPRRTLPPLPTLSTPGGRGRPIRPSRSCSLKGRILQPLRRGVINMG